MYQTRDDPLLARGEKRSYQVVEVDNFGRQTPVTIVSAYNLMHAIIVARHSGYDVEENPDYAIKELY